MHVMIDDEMERIVNAFLGYLHNKDLHCSLNRQSTKWVNTFFSLSHYLILVLNNLFLNAGRYLAFRHVFSTS